MKIYMLRVKNHNPVVYNRYIYKIAKAPNFIKSELDQIVHKKIKGISVEDYISKYFKLAKTTISHQEALDVVSTISNEVHEGFGNIQLEIVYYRLDQNLGISESFFSL